MKKLAQGYSGVIIYSKPVYFFSGNNTLYLNEEFDEDTKSQHMPSFVSIGVALITFIGIVFYHISLVLKLSSIWQVHVLPFIQKSLLLSTILRITPVTKNKTTAVNKDTAELHTLPTSTEINVDLREPLLEITE